VAQRLLLFVWRKDAPGRIELQKYPPMFFSDSSTALYLEFIPTLKRLDITLQVSIKNKNPRATGMK